MKLVYLLILLTGSGYQAITVLTTVVTLPSETASAPVITIADDQVCIQAADSEDETCRPAVGQLAAQEDSE